MIDVKSALGEQSPGVLDECLDPAFRQEQVVDVQADLTGVEHLHPHDPLCGGLDREVGADDGGRLAAELERHWRQVARGAGHHRAAGLAGYGTKAECCRQSAKQAQQAAPRFIHAAF